MPCQGAAHGYDGRGVGADQDGVFGVLFSVTNGGGNLGVYVGDDGGEGEGDAVVELGGGFAVNGGGDVRRVGWGEEGEECAE
jgi:hypothetical protein